MDWISFEDLKELYLSIREFTEALEKEKKDLTELVETLRADNSLRVQRQQKLLPINEVDIQKEGVFDWS